MVAATGQYLCRQWVVGSTASQSLVVRVSSSRLCVGCSADRIHWPKSTSCLGEASLRVSTKRWRLPSVRIASNASKLRHIRATMVSASSWNVDVCKISIFSMRLSTRFGQILYLQIQSKPVANRILNKICDNWFYTMKLQLECSLY